MAYPWNSTTWKVWWGGYEFRQAGVLKKTLSQKEWDDRHNLNTLSDLRVTIQCNCRNVYLDVLELKISFFTQYLQATQWDNVECVSVLLTQDADPHLMDFSGNTALHHAVSRGNIAIASKLLEYNVDIEGKTEVKISQLPSHCVNSNATQTHFPCSKVQASSLAESVESKIFLQILFFIFCR